MNRVRVVAAFGADTKLHGNYRSQASDNICESSVMPPSATTPPPTTQNKDHNTVSKLKKSEASVIGPGMRAVAAP